MNTGRMAIRIAIAMALLFAFTCVTAQSAQSAAPQFKWLCKPGRVGDPCTGQPGGLLTERVSAAGRTSTSTPKTMTRLKSKVDCFYVYPTVSTQVGPNANLNEDPVLDSIAAQQAARFAPGCRVFAPIYRQYTIGAIFASQVTEEVSDIAYTGVKAAWNEYLRKYNKGRGIVLIGHSQGTGHLKTLIADTFDQKPNLRKRLVSAVLIGGNVIVAKGKRTGGSFSKVPSCVRTTELGCVIAYSGFLKDPPPLDSSFGRIPGALTEPGLDPATHEVLCVNPARLDGSKGILKPLYNTPTFPGVYGMMLPNLTSYGSPWVNFPNLYSASCKRANGANWLSVQDVSNGADSRPRIGEPLGRDWGTHLTELNDAAGNLITVVKRQEKAYVRKLEQARKAKARKNAKQRHSRR